MARLFRGRASYKASDVAALFLLSVFAGMLAYLFLYVVSSLVERFFG